MSSEGILPALASRVAALPRLVGLLRAPFPPGHFYSPVPDIRAVRARDAEIFAVPPDLPGIDLAADAQLARLPAFAGLAAEMPFRPGPVDGLRYRLANGWFDHGDGVALYSWLRILRPRRYVEIGSGWSSALALDVNDRFLDRTMHATFVEPHPQRLHELLRPGDHTRVELVAAPLHAAPPDTFAGLAAGDVVFIDSSHVSRIGSDVNQLLLEVLPGLPAGVFVHVHDIFYPFEYPRGWVYQGRAWTEAYLLRALLIGNGRLRIRWFNSYLGHRHRARVAAALPAWAPGPGCSIWLETT